MKKRIVADTNLIVSAIFGGNHPQAVLTMGIQGQVTLVTSPDILAELGRGLAYTKFIKRLSKLGKSAEHIVEDYAQVCELVYPETIQPFDIVIRDPKDEMVLACAVAGNVEYIVSGDKDLTDLGIYGIIRIMTTSQFLAHLTP